jgi:hypothetical protein
LEIVFEVDERAREAAREFRPTPFSTRPVN